MVRVQALIASAGLASRRTAEEWIRQGRVTINDRTAVLGDRADPAQDTVAVNGIPLPEMAPKQYIALHKPVGYTTTLKDRHADHVVAELIPQNLGRLFPIGRLDRDTSGLLLMTNDGDLAHRLAHPSFEVAKVYVAEIEGVPAGTHIARLRRGIPLAEGMARARQVSVLSSAGGRSVVRLTLTEGRKREVRRLFQAVGHPVLALQRVEFAGIRLDTLPVGAFRPLSSEEVTKLKRLVGLAAPASRPRPKAPPRKSERREESQHGFQPTSPAGSRQPRRRAGVPTGRARAQVRHPRRNSGRTDG